MELNITSSKYVIKINNDEAHLLGIDKITKAMKLRLILCILNCIIDFFGDIYMSNKYTIRILKNNKEYIIAIFPQKKLSTSFAVQFSTENELLTLTEQLYKNRCSKLCVSSIYVYDEKYYLLITPITKSIKPEMICKEFSMKIVDDLVKILNIQRFGLRICSTNAIDKLGETIC